ncbi:hypothetical protein [Mycobacterium numidiamassiliense]|uniref:hypothetical protein n=1 Tax=Mycobacterium numidiamassiliense TaxID=1841861 RepID=UPI001055CA31|nr:hypothetical protein [Mycobacterium numidiamassiliense]
MTTATTQQPDIPLPAGAMADAESWGFWDNQFRIFHGADRVVSDPAGNKVAEVQTGGIQFPDGSIDQIECPPRVDVYVHADDGLTADQARELALLLALTADEVDRWTRHVATTDSAEVAR